MDCHDIPKSVPMIVAAYSVFEFWIGKSKSIKANSLIELLGITVFVIAKLIISKKGNDNGKTI